MKLCFPHICVRNQDIVWQRIFRTTSRLVYNYVDNVSWNAVNTLRWRHDGHDGVSNHQPHHCLLNRLFGCRSKKTSKLRVNGLCVGNSPGTGEFPAQMASNAENVSLWWRHHDIIILASGQNEQNFEKIFLMSDIIALMNNLQNKDMREAKSLSDMECQICWYQ